MKKATLTVTFDGAKLDALKCISNSAERVSKTRCQSISELCTQKNVPAGVREFIDMRSASVPRRKPVRKHESKEECDENG